ncbi:MAG: hypothetical protein P8X82_09620 [Gemmatimonadales bacterium]
MKITRGSVLMVLWFAATLASTPLRAAEQEARSLAQRARNPIDPEVSYLIVQNNWLPDRPEQLAFRNGCRECWQVQMGGGAHPRFPDGD